MTPDNIQAINIRTASDNELLAAARITNRVREEKLPNDPPIPVQDIIAGWRNLPSMYDVYGFIAWNAGQTDPRLAHFCHLSPFPRVKIGFSGH